MSWGREYGGGGGAATLLQHGSVFTLADPVAGNYYKIGKVPFAGVLDRVNYFHVGGTSVVFNLFINTESQVNGAGTKVWTSDKTSTVSNVVVTSFTANTMAQYSTLWLQAVTVNGAVDFLYLDPIFKET